MPHSERVAATAIVAAAIILATSCTHSRSLTFPGRGQAASFQAALRRCLAHEDITYEPVVEAPGSTQPLVPAPVPYEWWAVHGGYGLIDDQSGEATLDPTWVDPNQAVARAASLSDWTQGLYGPGGSPDRFDEGSCFDQALRRAGFFTESRRGTIPAPTAEQARAAGTEAEVVAAQDRRNECLIDAGISTIFTGDPEGSLRRRFIERGLIVSDAVHAPNATDRRLQAARDLEERVALADARCRQQVGFDRAVDTALRRLIDGAD